MAEIAKRRIISLDHQPIQRTHHADLKAKENRGLTPFEAVATLCSFSPKDCTEDALKSSAEWPTGSCKQT